VRMPIFCVSDPFEDPNTLARSNEGNTPWSRRLPKDAFSCAAKCNSSPQHSTARLTQGGHGSLSGLARH
jgi:hypothetical protein